MLLVLLHLSRVPVLIAPYLGSICILQDQRFAEVLSVAEATDVESMKKAVRKSRVVYNRGGADEQPADPGGCTGHKVLGMAAVFLLPSLLLLHQPWLGCAYMP